jgi:hypothetical protein
MAVFGFTGTVALFLRKRRRGSVREFRKLRNVKFFTLLNFMYGLRAVLSL